MNDWIGQLSVSLGIPAPSPAETGAILRLARDVAHGVERKLAPLSTFLAGVAVGRAAAEGGDRAEALREAVEAARALIPAGGFSDREGPPAGSG
jgi:hypothetical protein